MKKSILALGAAAAVAGFAGVAHAKSYFGDPATPPQGVNAATDVALAANGVGHVLLVPYYTTQNDNNTLLSIVNTDNKNGKAVKVRFRGAANSDDVLDFTVFLSPNDVYTMSLVQGADGRSRLTSPDNSCTLPADVTNVPFNTDRLQQSLSADLLAEHTREGYVEILNMADIPAGSDLYTNIKHVNDVAPCDAAKWGAITEEGVFSDAEAEAAGLAAPTGGLMGGWQIVKLSNISTYSGTDVAVAATDVDGVPAYARIAFATQSSSPLDPSLNLSDLTADPLLANGVIAPLTFDLPDLSTPMFATTPDAQVERLSDQLAKKSIMNEFVSTAAGAPVPGSTDWVVSQPTRRYSIAVDYTAAGGPKAEVNTALDGKYYAEGVNIAMNKISTGKGDMLCAIGATLTAYNREERTVESNNIGWSPATPQTVEFCGEVFVLSFNDGGVAPSQVLSANLTKQTAKTADFQAGWAKLNFKLPTGSNAKAGVPVVGFAATSLLNKSQNGNYGYTLQHRW